MYQSIRGGGGGGGRGGGDLGQSVVFMNIHYAHPVNYDTAVEFFLKMHQEE